MNDFNRARVSLVATHVVAGTEDQFRFLVDELHGLIRMRGYGDDRLLQDASDPRLFYHFRTWSSPEAALVCADDTEVQALWQRLEPIVKVTHLVGMATQVADRVADGTRTTYDRRAADRRMLDLRSPVGERRSGERQADDERRLGSDRRDTSDRRSISDRRADADRRRQDLGPPDGSERRSGDRREAIDRRALATRRADRARGQGLPDVAPSATPDLIVAARAARLRAQATFSGFKVGAALETRDGAVITGCNIENATYGLTLCAERVAMFKAISEGHRSFARIAVVADTKDPSPPCGPCRQILWEFGGDLEVILANLTEHQGTHRLAELLPMPFDQRLLGG